MNTAMNKLLKQYIPMHPGEMLKEELYARKIDPKQFCSRLGMDYEEFNDLLNGRALFTPELSQTLEQHLGIQAAMFQTFQRGNGPAASAKMQGGQTRLHKR